MLVVREHRCRKLYIPDATAVHAKRLSAMKPVATTCAVAPAGYGPSESNAHTLAVARKNGFPPIRNSRHKHKAAKSDITAASVMKQLPAASQDFKGLKGRPNNKVMAGAVH